MSQVSLLTAQLEGEDNHRSLLSFSQVKYLDRDAVCLHILLFGMDTLQLQEVVRIYPTQPHTGTVIFIHVSVINIDAFQLIMEIISGNGAIKYDLGLRCS